MARNTGFGCGGGDGVWTNDGSGQFRRLQQNSFARAKDLALADVDFDGNMDVVTIGNTFDVWLNADFNVQPLPGDFDFDDFLILADHFGQRNPARATGDLDGDRDVDFADFLILANNFGTVRQPPIRTLSRLPMLQLERAILRLPHPSMLKSRTRYSSGSTPTASLVWMTR